MESLLLELRTELRQQTQKLNEVSEALKELKAETSLLKKEVLGIGNNQPNGESNVGLIDSKTIREVVDRIQFDLTEVKDHMKGCPEINKPRRLKFYQGYPTPSFDDEQACLGETFEDYFSPVPIRSETAGEEMNFIKAKFDKLKQRVQTPSPGKTLAGTTIEGISSSIKFSDTVKTSIVIQFSNFLMTTITCTGYYYVTSGRDWTPFQDTIRGPSKIIGLYTEAFTIRGLRDTNKGSLLYTFQIEPTLSLALSCETQEDGEFCLRFGFIPTGLPLRSSTVEMMKLCATTAESSIKMSSSNEGVKNSRMYEVFNILKFRDTKIPADLVAAHEKYIARARMTSGPRSLVYVDILESYGENPNQQNIPTNIVRDGKSMDGSVILKFLHSERIGSPPDSVSCIVEIVNGLGVPLKNGRRFTGNCSSHSLMPNEIFAMHRDIVFSSDELTVEEIFSYEIDTTDVRLEIALRVKPFNNNNFGAAFVPISSATTEEELKFSLNASTWKTLMSRKYANANEVNGGEQIIYSRNIRARVSMTNENRSNLKVFVYTV